ncbi:hypothetical protein JFU49_03330 [Pseudomonas sp. TH03]|uniref:ArsR/SmtB family transcription factor n=1 Tax=Pseudomonas sp. TH03 TaxID=2796369 RepID=UPI00191313B1|nr:helix-turn-helix domain-containing protein [Pseudomonas sp. TH03]MBK5549319.1 hypothetical protein [Pseudomonas sp. TH03]
MAEAPILTLDILAGPQAVAPDQIQENFFVSLAERMERAITGASRQPLQVLSIKLNDAFDISYCLAAPETRKSLRDQVPGSILQAYRLGQLNYAQSVAAKAADRRVSDEFIAEFNKPKYKACIKALWHRELNCGDLARATNESEENISRKLKLLRELGVTDFWREGTSLYNFLTPAARALVPEDYKLMDIGTVIEPTPMALELARRRSTLDQRLREPPTFVRGAAGALSHA